MGEWERDAEIGLQGTLPGFGVTNCFKLFVPPDNIPGIAVRNKIEGGHKPLHA
jgi:hypothetical protein